MHSPDRVKLQYHLISKVTPSITLTLVKANMYSRTTHSDGLCRPKVKPHSADGRCPCCAKDPTRKRSGQNSDTEINYKDTLCIPRETVINVEVLGEMEVGQEQG